MLLECHEVGQNLRGVELIGQAIPHWYTSVFGQVFYRRVLKAAEFNPIKHPAQHLRSVLNRLLLAELDVVFAEKLRRNAKVIGRHGKGTACTGRILLKQEGDLLTLVQAVRHTLALELLEFVRDVEHLPDFL